MIVFISDLHIGATVPLTKAGRQMRAQVRLRGQEPEPLKLQLTARAVRLFYSHLTRLAKGADAKQVTIVLLGDVFDFIQTRAWQDLKRSESRPWVDGDPTEAQVLKVFREIIRDEPVNRAFFAALRATNELHWQDRNGTEQRTTVTRVYVPGNHDRLCNLPEYGKVRGLVRTVLGIAAPAGGTRRDEFLWQFDEPDDHHVFARHGHVFDANNYAGDAGFSKKGHERTPIGDLLTTQIASRLYDEMAHHLVDNAKASAHQTYAQIVRALEAMFAASGVLGPVGFLWKRLCRRWHGGAILKVAVQSLAHLGWGFSRLCCGRAWFGRGRCSNFAWALRTSLGLLALVPGVVALVACVIGLLWLHLHRLLPMAADLWPQAPLVFGLVAAVVILALTLQTLPRKPIPVTSTIFVALAGAIVWRAWLMAQRGPGLVMPVWASVLLGLAAVSILLWLPLLGSLRTDANLKRGAQREAAERGPDLRCIVYGHTHNPLEELLAVGANGKPVYYLNSGTWHQKLDAAADGSDFVSHKNMTYVVIYNDAEATKRPYAAQQYFETWTGTLYDGDCFRPDDVREPMELIAAHAAEARAQANLPGDVNQAHDDAS